VGMNAPAILEFKAVSKAYVDARFKPVQALHDLTFSVSEGEFVSVIGPSGCGKSTLLRVAAGLEKASAGDVLYRGKPVTDPGPERGFVFQSYNAFPWLTVQENVGFGLHAKGLDNSKEEVSKWLALTGLQEFADSYPKALSGGMRQRLAIARAMIVKPRLLLLDEPFGALDERIRETMQQLLLQVVSDSGCTVVFVTHDIREALFLGDQVLLLTQRPGRILKSLLSPLSKPRTREHMRSQEFISMYEQVVDSFPVSSHPKRAKQESGL
jgi:NitT/TauT family transport system ATP-binding protein